MSEGVSDRDTGGGVVPVADEDAFAVADMTLLAGEVQPAGVVFQTQRDGLGEMAGRVDDAEQDVGDRTATGLAEKPSLHDRVNAVVPSLERDNPAVGEDHHGGGAAGRDGTDQLDLLVGQLQARSVEPLGLLPVAEPGEDDGDVRAARGRDGLVTKRLRSHPRKRRCRA